MRGELRPWIWVLVGLALGYGFLELRAVAQPAPPPVACETQLKQTQVELQIVTQARSLTERQWAAIVIQVDTLTQENTTLKQQLADEKKRTEPAGKEGS